MILPSSSYAMRFSIESNDEITGNFNDTNQGSMEGSSLEDEDVEEEFLTDEEVEGSAHVKQKSNQDKVHAFSKTDQNIKDPTRDQDRGSVDEETKSPDEAHLQDDVPKDEL